MDKTQDEMPHGAERIDGVQGKCNLIKPADRLKMTEKILLGRKAETRVETIRKEKSKSDDIRN